MAPAKFRRPLPDVPPVGFDFETPTAPRAEHETRATWTPKIDGDVKAALEDHRSAKSFADRHA